MRRYICPLALAHAEFDRRAETFAKQLYWEAPTMAPTGATLVIFQVEWASAAHEEAFEAQLEVTPLGEPWEPIPLAAVAVFEQMRVLQEADKLARGVLVPNKGAVTLPSQQDPSVAIDVTHTLSQALRKAAPHLWR